MDTLVVGASADEPPAALDWIVTANSATGLVEWAPVVLFATMLLWLAYATRTRPTETLNARSAREVEEARR